MRLAAATAAGSETPAADEVADCRVEGDDRSGQRGRPGQGDALADDLDGEVADPSAPIARPGERDGVADQQQSVRWLQSGDERPHAGIDVDPVGDELNVDGVVEQGRHGDARRMVIDAAHGVEQMRRRARSGVVSGPRLGEGRRGVTDRDRDVALVRASG